MLTMSTLMMPAPASITMSTPVPQMQKIETKIALNHNTTSNKAGTSELSNTCFFVFVPYNCQFPRQENHITLRYFSTSKYF